MKNLKFLREARNLSQYKLAALTGISARRISSYEKDGVHPDIDTIAVFADFFNVSIDYLIGRSENVFELGNTSPLILSKFGERIQQFRIAKKLSIQAVASKSGITPSYLKSIESGSKIPKLETAVRLLNAVEGSADAALMDSLIAGYVARARFVEYKISVLTPENQKLALDLLEALVDKLDEKNQNAMQR